MNACAGDTYLGPPPGLCDEIHPRAESGERGIGGGVVKSQQLKAFMCTHIPLLSLGGGVSSSMVIFPWGHLLGSLVDFPLSFGLGRVEKDGGRRG